MEKKSILIIDDDKAVLASFRDLLEMKGYRVGTAENGREAFLKANSDFYNLALIDIKLPDIEGTELIREFRQAVPEMKRIIITGYSTRKKVIESLNLGADGYLEKPILPGKLLRFVADKLEEQETENQLYEDTVNDLLRKKDSFLHNLDRWS
jgi:DNA-binding NtrC family response regulator